MNKLKVLFEPRSEQIGLDNGVGQVIANYERYFPQVDIELVGKDQSYDISVSTLGFNINADVHHNHGLWLGSLNSDFHEQNNAIVESVRRARETVVPSNYVARYFRRDMRLDPHVVGHGVNWDEWQGGENRGYILWDKNRSSVICNPEPVSVLAHAFPNTPFVSTFANDDAPHNVYTTGRIPFEEMKRIVKGCAVYLGTTKETFGIGALQAMSAGSPVVGYDQGGLSDIVRNGIDGILVTPDDEEALKQALHQALQSRDELGTNARERAKQFSWLEVAKHIRAIYNRAAQPIEHTVGVVIPCYNYSDVLERAVSSVQAQTYADIKEIIIVDDGSTDATPEVAKELARHDNRVLYIRQKNAGVANARNTGIANATSTYICCLDADDEIKPTFIEKMVYVLKNNKGIRLAYSKIEMVFPNGDRGVSQWPDEFNGADMLKGRNQIPTCCLFHKEDWRRLGGYKQRYCPRGFGAEDAEFWLRFTKHGYRAVLATEEPLFVYHLGGGTSKDYQEPNWMGWHTDMMTGWYPFAAIGETEVHAVTDYENPTYSVIIPVGPGHEHYLEDALDSVEAQSDKRWECIVVWNMRPEVLFDNPVVDRLHFAYPFVKFINAHNKLGAGYARNVGAQHASGEYLVFLDADDYLQPRFLEITRKSLEHFGGDWVYTDLITQTNDGVKLFECYDWDVERLWRHGIMGVTCLYKKSDFIEIGGFDEKHNREDWDFHLRLARAGKCGLHLPLPLFTYRQNLGYRREYRKIAKNIEESKEMKREDVKRIHETFNLEEIKMACSGCPKRADIKNVSSNELETMTYSGAVAARADGVTFIGPVTGQRYRTNDGKIINVHPQDAAVFEERRLFKRVESVKTGPPIVSPTPKAPQVEERTWGEELAAVNEEVAKASQDARTETERMLREMFGEDEFPTDEPPEPTEQDAWWQAPENHTIAHNKTLIDSENPSQEKLETMLSAEREGKNRVTLTRYIEEHLEADQNGDTIQV